MPGPGFSDLGGGDALGSKRGNFGFRSHGTGPTEGDYPQGHSDSNTSEYMTKYQYLRVTLSPSQQSFCNGTS